MVSFFCHRIDCWLLLRLHLGATKEAGLIKTDESESTSTRYACYLPFWA